MQAHTANPKKLGHSKKNSLVSQKSGVKFKERQQQSGRKEDQDLNNSLWHESDTTLLLQQQEPSTVKFGQTKSSHVSRQSPAKTLTGK